MGGGEERKICISQKPIETSRGRKEGEPRFFIISWSRVRTARRRMTDLEKAEKEGRIGTTD